MLGNLIAHQSTGSVATGIRVGGTSGDLLLRENVVYAWSADQGGGQSLAIYSHGGGTVTVRENQFQLTTAGTLVNHAPIEDQELFTYDANAYFSTSAPSVWFQLDKTLTSLEAWEWAASASRW